MKRMLPVLLMSVSILGCTTTQKSTGVGTMTGATLGGIIGHQSDHGVEGAAIGAAAGALGGYIVGEQISHKKFCPVGGEVYDESVVYCPTHGVELKYQTE